MGEIVEFDSANRGELQVNMSHAITRASHGLSLVEKRIVALFIAKFSGKKRIKGVRGEALLIGERQVKITAEEYSETFGVDPKIAYRDLIKASETFLRRNWSYKRPTKQQGKFVTTKGNWLSTIEYHDGEGWVEATFTNETVPHLIMALGEQFTKYRLKATAALTGTYTWRLWELLSQYADPDEKTKQRDKERWIRITLDDFKLMMEAPKSYKFSQIRQKIIEPAIKQIKDKNEIKVDWKPLKKGRSVNALEFRFTPSEQLTLFGANY